MSIVHFNTAFENMTLRDIRTWIKLHKNQLIGSAVFTMNNSLTSKVVRWAERLGDKNKSLSRVFIPSHTGSIVEKDGKVYIFDMKPIRAKITLLEDYILNTEDIFALVLRNFSLDTKMFSCNILEYEGRLYPYMSAIRSILKIIPSKWDRHCSELHLRELQKQKIYQEVNSEITPLELWDLLK